MIWTRSIPLIFILLCLSALMGHVADSRHVFADDADLLSADLPIDVAIDHYIDERMTEAGANPAPPVDDFNFIRRVTLDLAGRIPLSSEVQSFVADADPQKRVALVDRLLDSPDFAYHQQNEFSQMLLPPDQQDGEFRDYLLTALQENRPWDQMFVEMMLGRDTQPELKKALVFLKKRARDIDDLTNDTSAIFFGVSINCAKCHDHPLVYDWTQDHYFGMSQFFRGTWLTKKNFLAEREVAPVSFKTTAGEEKTATMMFLTGELADFPPPLPEPTDAEKKAADDRRKQIDESETPPSPPLFSAREELVELALGPLGAEYFSKSIVNRLWARLIGTGLVTPVDQMHSGNPSMHPKLLRWLARDMREHEYDLKWMIRGIVLSRTYARSSRWDSSDERPTDSLFAVGSVRPLSPMQYSLSLRLASSNPEQLAQQVQDAATWSNRRRDLENQAQGFAGEIDVAGENFQVSIDEALLISNGERFQNEFLAEGGDRLLTYVLTMTDESQRIPQVSLAILNRPPAEEEAAAYEQFLADRADRPAVAWRQLMWVLLAGSEFRFNY